MIATGSSNAMSRSVILRLAAWIGIPAMHIAWMLVDWNFRDPAAPMSGGIPDVLTMTFQWLSLAAFGFLVFASMDSGRPFLRRAGLALLATGIAFLTMLFGWLAYVIENGIDTL